MQVLKFGGTSVGSAANMSKAADIIRQAAQKDRTIVVISAMAGVTDLLLQCGSLAAAGDESYLEKLQQAEQLHLNTVKELIPATQQSSILSLIKKQCNEIEDICKGVFLLKELSERTIDSIVSYGELISSRIVSARLNTLNTDNTWKDARELICTDSEHTHAGVDFKRTGMLVEDYFYVNEASLTIVPGFIASDPNGVTTTLGRGGSDYTAAILAAATEASVLEIWTDVSGMMTADPRLVPNAKIIASISYKEAMELSHFGAKVVYPPTILPVMRAGIPVRIKNTFSPGHAGTLIQNEPVKNGSDIRGISSINKIALVSLEG
ncbi:MAG TPA: aspartate kinase, partial [Chitinophagaceae bacterium]|nr:aspartate kinase [Chitinophagaceae bacterium]